MDYLEEYYARRERERQRFLDEKPVMMDNLRQWGVSRALFEFDGYGDDGTVSQSAYIGITNTAISLSKEREEQMLSWAEQALEHSFGGWEINEGSFGNVILDTNEDAIRIEFNQRIETSEYSEVEI